MLQWSKLHGFVLLCLIATTATASQLQAGAERLLPVFRNVNLVRSLNLEKSYERATVSVMIENISEEPQRSYYLAFDAAVVPRLGGLEVRDKNDASKTALDVEAVASTDSR